MAGSGMFNAKLATEALADATELGRRAAEWTAHAALHAGVFTRLQLRAWLQSPNPDTERAEASRIITALRNSELATEEDLAGVGRYVHIHAKQVYRALGEPDNRNRRRPAREKALERLLCLDYVLDHPDEVWLPTEGGKTKACEEAGIDREAWPQKVYPAKDGECETTRYFVEKFPFAVDLESQRVVAGCVSPGSTNTRLKSWLETYGPLLEALGRAGFALTLVHVSARAELEESAGKDLERAARRLGSGDSEDAELERIRRAIRACSEESLESVGGLPKALETVRKIQARRATDAAAAPVDVTTRAWTSLRIAHPEGDS